MSINILSYYKQLPIAIHKIVIASFVISVFFILKSYTNHLINQYNFDFSWGLISLKIMISYLLWLILTPLAYYLTKALQKNRVSLQLRIFKFLIGCVILAIIHQVISSRIDDVVNYINNGYLKSFFGHNNLVTLIIGSFSSFIELLVIISVFSAIDYQTKYIQNQKTLITAQLNALRMQLHPHFLFNTLHSIASMIDIDTISAQKMLSKLGSLLRSMLEYDAEEMVTVAEELKFVKDYLDLEQVRYQDRVTINYSVSQEVLNARIPNMIFQPLVENAVKYGIIPTVEDGEVNISIQQEYSSILNETVICLEISNTYNTESQSMLPKSTGVGHENIKKRLEQFYQDNFLFSSNFVTPKLYVAKITIPLIR